MKTTAIRKQNLTTALLLTLSLSYGCSSGTGQGFGSTPEIQTLSSELVHNTLLCGDDITQPGLSWISDEATLRQRYQHFNDEAADPVAALATLDFAQDNVLLIAMGPQPTSGYRLNEMPETPPRFDGINLEVPIAWFEPEADSNQAQALTNPCMLLSIPKVEFEQVRVLDQDGLVKLSHPEQ